MEVKRSIILPQPETQKEREFFQVLKSFINDTQAILNRGIMFSDNVDCRLVSFESSGTPDAENTVAHTLGKVPTGYIIYRQSAAGILYDGASEWTATNIYLKCDTASVTFYILVF